MDDDACDRLEPLPPSAKLVYYVLDTEGRFDQTGLADETRLSTRTVRFAIEKLVGVGLVEEGLCPTDARRSVYRAVDPAGSDTGSDSDSEASSAHSAVVAED